MIIACATPSAYRKMIKASAPSPPKWVLVPPPPDNKYHYFVGMATKAPNLPRAREIALNNATAEVIKFLGTKIAYEYERERMELGDEITQSIRSNLRAAAEGKVEGIIQKDAYYEVWEERTPEGKIQTYYNFYVLIAYSNKILEKEKEKIRKQIELEYEKTTALLRQGNSLYNKGSYWEALKIYLTTIKMAKKIEGGQDIAKEALLKAKDIAQNLKLIALDEISIKGNVSKPFRVKLAYKGTGVPKAPIKFEILEGIGKVEPVVLTNTKGVAVNKIKDFASPIEGIKIRCSLSLDNIKPIASEIDEGQLILSLLKAVATTLQWKGALKVKKLAVVFVLEGKKERLKDLEGAAAGMFREKGFNVVATPKIRWGTAEGIRQKLTAQGIGLLLYGNFKFQKTGEMYGLVGGKLWGTIKLINVATGQIVWNIDIENIKGIGVDLDSALAKARERAIETIKSEIGKKLQ